MKIKLFLSIIFFACVGFSQNCSFTIFNNSGQQFFVIMNGIKQNSIPQTNVKVSGMSLGAYSVKVIFADGKTGDLDKNVYFTEGGDHLARILIKGKKRKLQYFGVSDGSQPIQLPRPIPLHILNFKQEQQSLKTVKLSVLQQQYRIRTIQTEILV